MGLAPFQGAIPGLAKSVIARPMFEIGPESGGLQRMLQEPCLNRVAHFLSACQKQCGYCICGGFEDRRVIFFHLLKAAKPAMKDLGSLPLAKNIFVIRYVRFDALQKMALDQATSHFFAQIGLNSSIAFPSELVQLCKSRQILSLVNPEEYLLPWNGSVSQKCGFDIIGNVGHTN